MTRIKCIEGPLTTIRLELNQFSAPEIISVRIEDIGNRGYLAIIVYKE